MQTEILTNDQMLWLLDDTMAYYGIDPTRRSVNYGVGCQFRNERGNCCAVGRLIGKNMLDRIREDGFNRESLRRLVMASSFDIVIRVGEDTELVLRKRQDLSMAGFFLTLLQILHDTDNYWSDTGWNNFGLTRADELRKMLMSKEVTKEDLLQLIEKWAPDDFCPHPGVDN